MIIGVKVKNLARWKGEHTINYEQGITILDGKYGVGKSSLLVDAFQLVMTNSARVPFDQIITKGESEAEVEVLWETSEGQKYKFYWYHKLKRTISTIDKKTGKTKETQEAAKTIWEVLEYSLEEQDYVKSFKSPEQILGIPYSIASKTFIIGQSDIDGFSKAGPTEKYDIIADSFNISTLFKIGDKALEKLKKVQTEKNVLLEDLKDINIGDFEKIEQLKQELDSLNKQVLTFNKQESDLSIRREQIRVLQNNCNNILTNKTRINENSKLISALQQIDLSIVSQQIEQLKKLLEGESTSEIEKIESEIIVLRGKKSHLDEVSTVKISEIESVKNVKLRSLIQELGDLQNKYNQTKVINGERFTDQYISSLQTHTYQNIVEQYNEKNKVYQELEKEKQVISHKVNTNSSIIQKISNLVASTCPTCFRELSEQEKQIVLDKFNLEKKSLEQEKSKNLQSISEITTQLNDLSKLSVELNELVKYQENKQYAQLGKVKQEEYTSIKTLEEQNVEKVKKEYQDQITQVTTQLVQLQAKYEQLTEKSKAKEYKEQIKQLETKTYFVEGRTYTGQEVITTISILQSQNLQLQESISQQIDQLGQKEIDLNSYIQQLSDEYNQNVIQVETVQTQRQQLQQQVVQLTSQVTNLETLKSRYEKVKVKVSEYNTVLERLEKISTIFGKKGQPKTIIEKIIIPQLELKTNSILDNITNGKYQVSFSLTSMTVDGRESKKNTFDILVHQDGIEQVYDSLSGGEKMNINYAMRLGITECLNDLLGKKTSDILILDEAFNAIDSDASEEQILKSIRETSKLYKQVFIITHVNELKDGLQGESKVYSIVKDGKYSKLQ